MCAACNSSACPGIASKPTTSHPPTCNQRQFTGFPMSSYLLPGVSFGRGYRFCLGVSLSRSPSSAFFPLFGGRLPYENRLRKKVGSRILTSPLEDLAVQTKRKTVADRRRDIQRLPGARGCLQCGARLSGPAPLTRKSVRLAPPNSETQRNDVIHQGKYHTLFSKCMELGFGASPKGK